VDLGVLGDYTDAVPEYCSCGAELPPDARFCHKCGKPQRDEWVTAEEEPETPAPAPPPTPAPTVIKFTPVNLSNPVAVRLGFVAALMGNLFTFLLYFGCPLWLFGAGLLAATWYERRTQEPMTMERGVRMGWITGLFSFMIFTVLFTFSFVAAVRSGEFERTIRSQMESLPFGRGNVEGFVELLRSPMGMAINLLVSLFVMFLVFTAFAAMGGALAAKLAQRRDGRRA
jgi:hypothetical protein